MKVVAETLPPASRHRNARRIGWKEEYLVLLVGKGEALDARQDFLVFRNGKQLLTNYDMYFIKPARKVNSKRFFVNGSRWYLSRFSVSKDSLEH